MILVRVSCMGEICVFEFGKKFKSWSMAVICAWKRFGSDKISMFVGTVSEIVACIAVVAEFMAREGSGIGCGGVGIGGDGRVEGDSVGREGRGGAEGVVAFVWTTCGCCMFVTVALSHGPYCCVSLWRLPPFSATSLQSHSSWFIRPHQ